MQSAASVFLLLLLATHSAAQQNCRGCGAGFSRDRIYEPALNTYVLPKYERDPKFWFYDSMVITERHRLNIEKDGKGKERWWREVIGYTFLDVRTKCFYNYGHFSDTARIQKATRQMGEGQSKSGWNYFLQPRIPHQSVPLTDTVLYGTNCHRLLGFWLVQSDTVLVETMYYVSEAKSPLISCGKTVVDGKRFSIIRLDDFSVANKIRHYSFIDVTSQNLTQKEMKVFGAWKRNAARHPVPKLSEGPYTLDSKRLFVPEKRAKGDSAQQ